MRKAVGKRSAALAWIRGTELWTLSVESPTPGADLERFAAGLTLQMREAPARKTGSS